MAIAGYNQSKANGLTNESRHNIQRTIEQSSTNGFPDVSFFLLRCCTKSFHTCAIQMIIWVLLYCQTKTELAPSFSWFFLFAERARRVRTTTKETEKLIVAIADNGKKEGRSGHTPRVCDEGMSLSLYLFYNVDNSRNKSRISHHLQSTKALTAWRKFYHLA